MISAGLLTYGSSIGCDLPVLLKQTVVVSLQPVSTFTAAGPSRNCTVFRIAESNNLLVGAFTLSACLMKAYFYAPWTFCRRLHSFAQKFVSQVVNLSPANHSPDMFFDHDEFPHVDPRIDMVFAAVDKALIDNFL